MCRLRLRFELRERLEVGLIFIIEDDGLPADLSGDELAGLDGVIQTRSATGMDLKEFFDGICRFAVHGDSRIGVTIGNGGDPTKTDRALPRYGFVFVAGPHFSHVRRWFRWLRLWPVGCLFG